jgi:hypothetical protein
VRFPWQQPEETTVEQPAESVPVAERTSSDWAEEIARLRTELDQLAVAKASLATEAGEALLDGHTARVVDLEAKLAEFATREQVISAAIVTAEERRQEAEANEQRYRLRRAEREYRETLATQLEAQAVVREAEFTLTRAVWVRDDVELSGRRDTLYTRLLGAGMAPVAFADLLEQTATPDGYRALAAKQRALAEAIEVVDPASLPPTERDRIVAETIAGQPERDRQARLTDNAIEIQKARAAETYATFDRKHGDAARHAGRLAELEQQRAELTGESRDGSGSTDSTPVTTTAIADLDKRIAAVRARLDRVNPQRSSAQLERDEWAAMLADLEQQRAAALAGEQTTPEEAMA